MSYLNWCNAYVTLKKGSSHYPLIGEETNRLAYDLLDGFVIKVPKKGKREKAEKQSEMEYKIWRNAPESIKRHLVPAKRLIFNAVIMNKTESIVSSDSREKIKITPEIKMVMDYLEKEYELEPDEMSFACNWGIYKKRYVLLEYGR